MIHINKLSKSYSKKVVLQNINLRLEQGRIYGVVGENGAGKTTLFQCIAGMTTFDGEISTPYQNLKNHLGYLETNPVFMSYITGWEYLKLLCTAKGIMTENFEEQNIFDLPLHKYVEHYSTGMKKKLALLGVILRKNEVYIFDEPFNGVDIKSNMIITEILLKLRSLNKIVLISSHIFTTLKATCDQIIHLSDTRIDQVYDKSNYDVLEKKMLHSMVDDQVNKLQLD